MKLPQGVKAVSVSSGEYYTTILGSDGKVYACGNNNFGQLGDGTKENRSTLTPMLDSVGEPIQWGLIDAVMSEPSVMTDVVSPPSKGSKVAVNDAVLEPKKQAARRETLAALIEYVDIQRESIQSAAKKRAQAAWFDDPAKPIEQWAVEAAMDLVNEESDVRKKYLNKEFPEMLEEAAVLQADTLSVANFQEWAEKLFRTRRDR